MPRANSDRSERSISVGSDFLQLSVTGSGEGGLADRLADRLRRAIRSGELAVDTRLPATRVLAADLGVSRGVVTEAYQRVTDEGLLVARGRGGTRVAGPLADLAGPDEPASVAGPPPAPSLPEPPASGWYDVIDASRAAPAEIDLSPGVPDLTAFPRAAWLRAERAVLAAGDRTDLGYGDARGAPVFREQVALWLRRYRGIAARPDEVIVVAGVAQAFALVWQVLGRRGVDTVAVEDPWSRGGREQLAGWGMATPGIPVDGDGLSVRGLADSDARVVVVTPAHQFPTGVVLSGERRRELGVWATGGGLIVEDDYDAEHRYDRPPVPALRATLPDRVCYAGSVSKLLAPALRVGWLLVPAELAPEVILAKRNADLGNAVLPQLVLARMMATGALERHLRVLRGRHRTRRDAMIAALRRELPSTRVHGAAAGLHLTLTLDEGVDDTVVAADALAAGVKVQPLSWHRQAPGPPGLVLGYAAVSPAVADAGVTTLARAVPRR